MTTRTRPLALAWATLGGGLRWPLVFSFCEVDDVARPTALATARKLAALRPASIAVGHGPAFDLAVPALMSALEHAEARSSVAGDAA